MKKYILTALVGLSLVGCRMDDNISPNSVPADKMTPQLRLSAAETSAYAGSIAGAINRLGNAWTNSWSGNFMTFGNPFTTESDLEISTSSYQALWNNTYISAARFQKIIDTPDAEQTAPNYVAIAKILKAYYMQYIVDLYGNAPYSEAFKEAEIPTPAYDRDVDVYTALVAELQDAIDLIDEYGSNPLFEVSSNHDVMLAGDMDAWKRFANTVLLKYAIRMSNTTDSDGIALRNSIISSLNGASFITENVTINPGYSNGSASQLNPLYANFGYTDAGETAVNTQGYMLMSASDHIVKSLLGDPSKVSSGVEDMRITKMYTVAQIYNGDDAPVETGYDGFIQGHDINEFITDHGFPAGSARPAVGNVSLLGGFFRQFASVGGAVDGQVMMLAEAELLQAEAAERGYAGFGSAQSHFENAIRASFDFYGLADEADDYITAINANPKAGWTGSSEDKIAAIQYQRWIALSNLNGIENFINYLRTGYPETPLASTTTRPNKPWRLLYPASEYSANSANVPDVSLDQIFTKNEYTPFIYK